MIKPNLRIYYQKDDQMPNKINRNFIKEIELKQREVIEQEIIYDLCQNIEFRIQFQ